MFSRFRKQPSLVLAPAAPAVPRDVVVWAVGDIHGRLDLLGPLVEAMISDLTQGAASGRVAIFLGDYIDRGPDSRGVLRLLANLPTDIGIEWRFLKGNHEDTMLNFLDDPTVGAQWCEYGGDATLRSYGLEPPNLKHKAEGWAHLSAELRHKVTARERAFLESQELSTAVGDYFFAHAGARPGKALDRQAPDDLLWIRRTFLNSEVEFEQIVVHGHTPTAEVHADHRRIGIDTRAYESGILTALRLNDRDQRIVQAIGPTSGEIGSPAAEVQIRSRPICARGDFVAV